MSTFGRLLVLAAVVAGSNPVPSSAPVSAAAPGTLEPVACIEVDWSGHDPACAIGRGIESTAFQVISGDGRFVYATGRDSDAVAILRRNAVTGRLTQLRGRAGCWMDVTVVDRDGCAATRGLDRAYGVALSRDGDHLYVAGRDADTVVAFRRNHTTGTIAPIGCVAGPSSPVASSCVAVGGLDDPVGVTVAPDGGDVLVTLWGGKGVLGLRRGAGGRLTAGACVLDTGSTLPSGCVATDGLDGASAVAVSPNGRHVYVTAPNDSAVTAFRRDPATGSLTGFGCISGDGVVRRDPACRHARGIQYAQNVAVAPDGRHVYVAATDSHTIAIFRRNSTTGVLTQLSGLTGCLGDAVDGPDYCLNAPGLALPLGIAFGRGGRRVYTGSFGYGSVASFARNPTSGRLSPLGCVSDGDPNCQSGSHLERAGFVAATRDGRHLYVNAPAAGAITGLAIGRAILPAAVANGPVRLVPGALVVTILCPRASEGGCSGRMTAAPILRGLRGRPSSPVGFDVRAGSRTTVTVPLTTGVRRALATTPGAHVELAVRTFDQVGTDSTAWWRRRVLR